MDAQMKRLMEAFRADCGTLLTRFELSYNTRFQNFCEIWRNMQFSLIFAHHPSEAILLLFCEEALSITKGFLVNANSLKERIGALYLIYAIYFKMPPNDLKIRMTISDWECLIDLHLQIKTEEYLDANYILCKLIVHRAFTYSISDSEYGIEGHFYMKQVKPLLDFNLMPEIKELAEPGNLLSTINKLSKVYEEKKRILCNSEGTSSLQLFDADMANNIIKNIRTAQSETRVFAKSIPTEASSSKLSSSSTMISNSDRQKVQKRIRLRKKVILSKIGRAFEGGLQSESESDEEQIVL